MAAQHPPHQSPGEDSITVSRTYDAPREQVFRAWTDPQYLLRWWAPNGFTTPTCTVDLRPGGRFRYCMRSPEGQDYHGQGVYREIIPNERIVYTDSFIDEDGNQVPATHYGMSPETPLETMVTVTFEDAREGTKVTLRHEIPHTLPEREEMREGWSQMLGRLSDALPAG